MKKLILFTVFCLVCNPLQVLGLFNDYAKLSPEEQIKKLEHNQVDNPDDPEINYNLGVALYRTNKFEEAKTNFGRAKQHAGKFKELEYQSGFNFGNACYQNTLSMLPKNWEAKETDVEISLLDKAINEVKEAIGTYKGLLKENKDDQKVTTNLKKAEELLKKLEKKKQQQQQNQEQKKDEKDQKDQKDQKEQQEQKDQKNQQQDKSQQQQDKQQQQQEQNKDQEKKDQQESSGEEQVKDQQGKGANNQEKGGGQKPPSKSNAPTGEREEQKLDQENNKDEQEKNAQHDQSPKTEEQPSQPQGTQGEEKKQEMGGVGQAEAQEQQGENMEQRSMRAILDNLQSDETKAQKAFMQQQMQQGTPPSSQGQKTW